MATHAAVGVDDDLAAGEATVAHRATGHEAACRVDEVVHIAVQKRGRNHRLDDTIDDLRTNVGLFGIGVMLRGDDNRVHGHRLVVLVADADLRLRVGAEPGEGGVCLAQVGELLGERVGVTDGHRHEHIGLGAGVAEHHALVAGALLVRVVAVDALVDVLGLLFDSEEHAAGVCVEANLGTRVANRPDRLAHDGGVVDLHISSQRDLAGQHDIARLEQRLAGDARLGVDRQNRVEDGIADLVSHFVGMAFGHGLRGKNKGTRHGDLPCGAVRDRFVLRAIAIARGRAAYRAEILCVKEGGLLRRLAVEVAGNA